MKILKKADLAALIEENPLQSLATIAEQTGNSRAMIEKWLKSYKLEAYRNQKIRRLRGEKARKRR